MFSPQKTGVKTVLHFAQAHPLFCYFFLAFIISWLFWLPYGLAQNGVLPVNLPAIFIVGGAMGPIAAGFIMAAVVSGKAGVRHLLRRMLLWRVKVWWYVFALFAFPLILWLGVVITMPDALEAFSLAAVFSTLQAYVSLFFLQQLLLVGLAEEPGWRGFALPRLQERYGAFKGSLILGVCWGLWHLPLFLVPDRLDGGISLIAYLITAVAATFVFTWVFNHTKGSVLIAMILHASNNAFPLSNLFPQVDISDLKRVGAMIVMSVVALAIIILTKGKLGYDPTINQRAIADERPAVPEKPRSKKKTIIKIAVIIFIVLLISILLFFYLNNSGANIKTGSTTDTIASFMHHLSS